MKKSTLFIQKLLFILFSFWGCYAYSKTWVSINNSSGLQDYSIKVLESNATVYKVQFAIHGFTDSVIVEKDADKNIVSTKNSESLMNVKKNTIVLDKKALGATEIPESAGKVKFTLTANDEGADLSGLIINDGEALGKVTSTEPFDGNTVTFTGLNDGTYTLREDTAPLGYSVVSDFTFTVSGGKVTDVSAVTNGSTV